MSGVTNRLDDLRRAATPNLPLSPTAAAEEQGSKKKKKGKKQGTERDIELGQVTADDQTVQLERFLDLEGKIKQTMERVGKATSEIEMQHRRVLAETSQQEAARFSRLIDELASRVTNDANWIRKSLREISQENEDLNSGLTPSNLRLRRTSQAKLAKAFLALMTDYQRMQQTYRGKYKQTLERQYLIVKPNATREELELLSRTEGAEMLSQSMFSMANKADAKTRLLEMQERHSDILAIEKSISELNQVFLDMAIIVDQQGELINRVGDHVQSTVEYTEKAAEQMHRAVAQQKANMRCKWISLAVITVLLLIVGIVLWQTLKK